MEMSWNVHVRNHKRISIDSLQSTVQRIWVDLLISASSKWLMMAWEHSSLWSFPNINFVGVVFHHFQASKFLHCTRHFLMTQWLVLARRFAASVCWWFNRAVYLSDWEKLFEYLMYGWLLAVICCKFMLGIPFDQPVESDVTEEGVAQFCLFHYEAPVLTVAIVRASCSRPSQIMPPTSHQSARWIGWSWRRSVAKGLPSTALCHVTPVLAPSWPCQGRHRVPSENSIPQILVDVHVIKVKW